MRPAEQIEAFCESARAYWRQQGSRHTEVREVLCRALAEADAPLTAEEILESARKVDRAISMASVYRTLGDLEAGGLLRAVPGPRDVRCYAIVEPGRSSVGNIVCRDCEKVVPLTDECLPLREGFLTKQLGFKPEKMTLRIEASCDELREQGVCDRRKEPGKSQAR